MLPEINGEATRLSTVKSIWKAASDIVETVIDPQSTPAEKIDEIKRIEKAIYDKLQSDPHFKNHSKVLKAFATVIIAAVFAVLGAAVGFAALNAVGVPLGSTTGWAVGIAAASVLGLTAGGYSGYRLHKHPRVNWAIRNVANEASKVQPLQA